MTGFACSASWIMSSESGNSRYGAQLRSILPECLRHTPAGFDSDLGVVPDGLHEKVDLTLVVFARTHNIQLIVVLLPVRKR